MLPTLAVVTVTVVGLMVGVEFAVAFVLNPILTRMPAGSFIDASADSGRVMGRAMPPWYIVSFVLTIALVVFTWGTTAAGLAVVAAALFAVTTVLSVAVLVPINNRSKTWTADEHPVDWREQKHRWDRLHYLRVAMIVAAFVLVAVASVSL